MTSKLTNAANALTEKITQTANEAAELADKWLTTNNSQKELFFSISLGGKNLTTTIAPQLISLDITDNLAFEADSLSITLNDDNFELPKRGVQLDIKLGFKRDQANLYEASFIVDELSVTGPPNTIEINASSANLRTKLNIRKSDSFSKVTLGELVTKIAAHHELKYTISPDLAAEYIEHIDQNEESDASFLIRILEDFGGKLAIKNNKMLIFKDGAPLTIDGKQQPPVIINRSSCYNFSFSIFDRGNYTGCRANFLNYRDGKKNHDPENNYVLIGTDENVKSLGHTYKNIDNATKAAKYHLAKLQRAACSFSIKLHEGAPQLLPGMLVKVTGFKAAIDGEQWQIVRVNHSLSKNSGFISSLELEKHLI